MNRRIALAGLIAAAPALAVLGAWNRGADSAPFNAQVHHVLIQQEPLQVTEDDGHASGLGSFTGGSTAYPAGPGMVLVLSTWDFANGTLTVEILTTFVDPIGEGTFTITGGTGDFAGASGGGTYFGKAVFPNQIESKLKGTISY